MDLFSYDMSVVEERFPWRAALEPVVQSRSCVEWKRGCVEAFGAEVDQAGDVSHMTVGQEDAFPIGECRARGTGEEVVELFGHGALPVRGYAALIVGRWGIVAYCMAR